MWPYTSQYLTSSLIVFAVRFALGALALYAFSKFREAVSQKFGRDVGICLAWITATQFHFLFYISRPLPNIFALVLGNYLNPQWAFDTLGVTLYNLLYV